MDGTRDTNRTFTTLVDSQKKKKVQKNTVPSCCPSNQAT